MDTFKEWRGLIGSDTSAANQVAEMTNCYSGLFIGWEAKLDRDLAAYRAWCDQLERRIT